MAMVAMTFGSVTIKDTPGQMPIDEKYRKDDRKPSLNVIQPRTELTPTKIDPEYYTNAEFHDECIRLEEAQAMQTAMSLSNELLSPGVDEARIRRGQRPIVQRWNYNRDGPEYFVN